MPIPLLASHARPGPQVVRRIREKRIDLKKSFALSPLPAVESVGFVQEPTATDAISVDGEARKLSSLMVSTGIDDQYFNAMGLGVTMGQAFGPQDRAGAPLVGIVTALPAKAIAGDQSPVGRRIAQSNVSKDSAYSIEIVGVVPDIIESLSTLEPLCLYQPIAQQAPAVSAPGVSNAYTLVVRAAAGADARQAVTAAIHAIDPAIRPDP